MIDPAELLKAIDDAMEAKRAEIRELWAMRALVREEQLRETYRAQAALERRRATTNPPYMALPAEKD